MILKNLNLINYKNFAVATFNFDSKINCFVGKNGVGKTNVLESIYYLSFTKGYFNSVASQHIKHNEGFFTLEGFYENEDREEIIHCSLKKGHKKVIKRNGKVYEKLTEHIGRIPLVIISPNDRDLIAEGSAIRRKFINGVIAQADINYLTTLIKYQKVLSQRNSLLKYFAANQTFNILNLEIYNKQLSDLGQVIFDKRNLFLKEFIPIFKKQYQYISNGIEQVSLTYKSQLEDTELEQLLKNNIDRDRNLQYTGVGIHKDDLVFKIDDYPIKKYGSQGQQKSYLIALKLAQFHFIKKQTETKPLLLLDDIFDKLDEDRVMQLIQLVNAADFGQLFISDTDAKRTEKIIKKTKQSYKMFEL
ncbi:MAG: DNA replication and repair protein RecF [Flavobacteriaceae bacterium]|nr:DNA replication and repair protein RecF [Flavobacteriaceae bacterium]